MWGRSAALTAQGTGPIRPVFGKELVLGTARYVTVYDRTGLAKAFVEPDYYLYATFQDELPALTKELAQALLVANRQPAYLALRLSFELSVVDVSAEEHGKLKAAHDERACQETVQARFPSPEFQGWLRLSRVGFNRARDQALVYLESYVCNGGGDLILLQRDGDTWRMTASTIVWLT